jgi:hypothetical protein
MVNVSIQVLNATTGQPLSGATLYMDGLVAGAAFRMESGLSHNFEARMAGFKGSSKSVEISGTSQTVTLLLTPVSAGVTVRIQFYPAVSGIQSSLHVSGADTKTAATLTGGVTEFAGVAPGDCTLEVNDSSYEPKTQQLAVSPDSRSFVVSLVRKASATTQTSPVGASLGISSGINPEDLIIPNDVSEDTYDNSAYLQYFTSAQVRLYIGSMFIDEMATIQWGMQQNNVPVFGYCSEFMDAIGRGRSIVQGQLVLNYVHQGYLYAALKNYTKFSSAADSGPSKVASVLSKLVQASTSGTTPAPSDPAAAFITSLQPAINTRLSNILQASTPADVQQAQQLLKRPAARSPYADNPVYKHIIFDMRLEIGDGPYKTVRMLEGCKLGVNEVLIHSQSGEAIAESYTFTARRAR